LGSADGGKETVETVEVAVSGCRTLLKQGVNERDFDALLARKLLV